MIQLVIIGAYLALLLGLGVGSSLFARGTSRDYLLASHSIGPVLLLLSLFGTTMTAFALVGSTGEAFTQGIGVYGMLASSSGIVHSLCFFLVGVKLWQLGKRHGYRTQVAFFRDRLECGWIGLFLFPVLVALVVPYLLIGVLGSGAVINGVTRGTFVNSPPQAAAAGEDETAGRSEEPHWMARSGLATEEGGIVPWAGSLVICVVVLIYVFFGGMRGTAWANAFQTVVFMGLGVVTFIVLAWRLGGEEDFLASLRSITSQVGEDKLTRSGTSHGKFITYLLIPLSVGMFPHIFQHWLTAKSAASFKLPVVAHPIFILIVWAPCVLIGVWATTSTAGVPDKFNPNAVLAFLVQKEAGELLGGLLTAGILAAIMSSLDSQFLCLGTMFTSDVVLYYWRGKPLSERAQVWLARSFIVLIVAFSFALSLAWQDRRVFQLGIWCFTGFTGLFPIVIAALYWRRLTKWGALAGILATAISWLLLFWQADFAGEAVLIEVAYGSNRFELLPVTAVILASAAATVGVSVVTRPPRDATLAKFFRPRTGRGAA